jgi:hypothetical protein
MESSNSNLIPSLGKLGRAIYIYGCIYIVSFIIGFCIGFIPGYPFAKKMFIYILIIIQSLTFVLIIMKAKNLKNNVDCLQSHLFYHKLVIGFVLGIISFLSDLILSFLLADQILHPIDALLPLIPDIVGGIIAIITLIYYINAWGQLGSLIGNNARNLPRIPVDGSLKAINFLQTASKIEILTYFTGIWLISIDTILRIVMLILFILGYMNAGKNLLVLDKLPLNMIQQASKDNAHAYINPNIPLGDKIGSQAQSHQPPSVFSSTKNPNYQNINDISDETGSMQQKFCPACGAPVAANPKFCTKCGVEIERK